jgi:molybdopterin/thiamine biosynthesis adenylyltransferase
VENKAVPNIDTLARQASLADGTPCRTIGPSEVMRLAEKAGVTGRIVEIEALRQNILPDRYLRNRKLLSESDQIRLLEAAVCIVGLGGLGGLVTETLARMGVGRFFLIDGDRFESHNLNRQLFSGIDTIGLPKAEAAAARVKMINPGLDVVASATYLTPENGHTLVEDSSIVVDCLDNIPSRFALEAAARRAGIPMVSAAVAGISGHVTTVLPGGVGLEAIYGPVDKLERVTGAENRLGCLAPGVNLMASLECTEVLKILLGRDNALTNRLLVVDLADYTFETLQLS